MHEFYSRKCSQCGGISLLLFPSPTASSQASRRSSFLTSTFAHLRLHHGTAYSRTNQQLRRDFCRSWIHLSCFYFRHHELLEGALSSTLSFAISNCIAGLASEKILTFSPMSEVCLTQLPTDGDRRNPYCKACNMMDGLSQSRCSLPWSIRAFTSLLLWEFFFKWRSNSTFPWLFNNSQCSRNISVLFLRRCLLLCLIC